MNYNFLPVKVFVLRKICLDGQEYPPGSVVQTDWLRCKTLEKSGMAIRIEHMATPPVDTHPVQDVMVFTPVYRLEPETVQAIMALEWDGPITRIFQTDNPGEDGRANHLHQYVRGRETFLAGRYEAMLVIESDVIPPCDALRKLAALGADVAYGVYQFRTATAINIFERYPGYSGVPSPNVGESLTYKPHLLRMCIEQGGKVPCSGGGLGCVLIRRKVLEAIPFRRIAPYSVHCDTWFTRDVYKSGYSMWADLSVICGHKKETGEILWPEYPLPS